jgi:hypothetical protein
MSLLFRYLSPKLAKEQVKDAGLGWWLGMVAISIIAIPSRHFCSIRAKNCSAQLFLPLIYIKKTNQYFDKNVGQVMNEMSFKTASIHGKASKYKEFRFF